MTQPILTLRRPDDFHLHLRQNNHPTNNGGDMLSSVLPFSENIFGRATIMPNIIPPIIDGDMAIAYKTIIEKNLKDRSFIPLMTLYLHNTMHPEKIANQYRQKKFFAIKYYPKNATTHSDSGVDDIKKMTHMLNMMMDENIPLLIHGEYIGRDKYNRVVDIFDREMMFIDNILSWLLETFPSLKISLEHITTQHAVKFLQKSGKNLGASITAHHLLINRNDIFHHKGKAGLNPHHYCLPLAKCESDREALLALATSGFDRVYGGSDSAPHRKNEKESAIGCAGIFSAPLAVEAYAMAFQQVNQLSKLENFLSQHGAVFFNLTPNEQKIALIEKEWQVPPEINILASNHTILPFMAGDILPIKAVRLP
ncbi:MAG: dihydroorotase [Alphaproteobacteria bacterium]